MVGTGRRWMAALAVAVSLLAACNGDDSDDDGTTVITDPVETSDDSTTSSETTETTVDPQADVEAEVEAAYLALWDAYVQILSDPNPEDPLIDAHYTGASREAILDGVSQMVLDGRALREPNDPDDFSVNVREVDVRGSTADLTTCVVDGLVQVDRASGDVVNDAVVSVEYEAEMRREANRWKLAEHIVVTRTDGAACDA